MVARDNAYSKAPDIAKGSKSVLNDSTIADTLACAEGRRKFAPPLQRGQPRSDYSARHVNDRIHAS